MEIWLRLELGAALMPAKGQASEEVRQAYARAEELCRTGEVPPNQPFAALRGLWNCHLLRCELRQASALVPEIAALADRSGDPDMVLAACRVAGTSRFQVGDIPAAAAEFERGVGLWQPKRHSGYMAVYGEDPGLYCAVYSTWVEDMTGRRDRALDRTRRIEADAGDFTDGFSQTCALIYASSLHQFRREPEAAREAAERAIVLCKAHDVPQWLAWAGVTRGWALARLGEMEKGLGELQRGIAAWQANRGQLALPYFLTLLAETLGAAGRPRAGLEALEQAETVIEATDHRAFEVEVHRVLSELLQCSLGDDGAARAEMAYGRALEVARAQGVRTLELRAAVSLARLEVSRGERRKAHNLLAPVYGWFTEGFDTPDLREARALLDKLHQASS
jgi:predicted ATPase